MASDIQLPDVGARINYSSHLGTVRFVGVVDGTKGVWLGVEWDDPQRGKHSGTKDGKHYFTCKVPNSGSFVRLSASIIFGSSFLQALSAKYVEISFDASNEKVILGSSKGAIQVEAVGMNKVRSKLSRLENLREVSLDKENVAKADELGEIRYRCPNIKGLDLSRSLIPTWEVLARIIEELSFLETLTLNFNRLELPRNDLGMAFAHVRDLRLNGALVAWKDMLELFPLFPELLHLELGLNEIQDLSDPPSSHNLSKIFTLNLQENRLHRWENVIKGLVKFPRLNRLILSENKFENIPRPSISTPPLDNISHLAFASNGLRSWADIDALSSWFPNLQTLNINFNPIAQDTSARALTIARVSTLLSLNASAISPAERNDSELFYLSHISKSSVETDEAREQEHPRYRELCEKHGRPTEQRELAADTLKNRLIETHFFETLQSSPPTPNFSLLTPRFTLRLLPSMSLRMLRLKILKTLKLPPQSKVQMWLALERGSLREFAEMDMETAEKPLEWWGPDNNSKIVYHVQ